MREPLVSIGLFTFNGAGTLRRALDTLLSQTYKNFELIVSDNASTDETPRILQEYAARDRRINYLRQKETINAADNQLFVLHKARGKYFMWAADDDWWDPKFIETLVKGLEENPEYGVAMSSYDLLWADGSLKNRVIFSGELDLTRQSQKEVFKKMLFDAPIHVFIYGLFRRDFLTRLMSRSLPRCARHDRVLMAEAALSTRFFTAQPVLYFKVRSDLPISERDTYKGDPMASAVTRPLARTSYFLTLPVWLLSSSLIPFSRKRYVILHWPKSVWFRKKRILGEFLDLFKINPGLH